MGDLIEKAIETFLDEQTESNLKQLLETIRIAMKQREELIVAVELPEDIEKMIEQKQIEPEQIFELDREIKVRFRKLNDPAGKSYVPVFTDANQVQMGEKTSTITISITELFLRVLKLDEVSGIVINPWGKYFVLNKQLIAIIIEESRRSEKNKLYFRLYQENIPDLECMIETTNIGRKDGEVVVVKRDVNGKPKHLSVKCPIYTNTDEAIKKLAKCYCNLLEVAKRNKIRSIGFPTLASGAYGYPLKETVKISVLTVLKWFEENREYGIKVTFLCSDEIEKKLYVEFVSKFQF